MASKTKIISGDLNVTGTLKQNGNAIAIASDLSDKQDKLTAGSGITINENNVISTSVIGVTYTVVTSLPASGEVGTIYLVSNSGTAPDVYDEYIYVNNGWELIGNTQVDLSNYYTKSETDTAIGNAIPASYLDTEVLLSSDLKCYYSVGAVQGTGTAPVTIGHAGDTLRSVLNNLFVMEEVQPTITSNPSVSITVTSSSSLEYGSLVSIVNCSITTQDGSYTYESTTGVTFTSYNISGTNVMSGSTQNTSTTVQFSTPIRAGMSDPVTINLSAPYTQGNIAKTNLGNDSDPAVRISSGTATALVTYNPTAFFYCYYATTQNTTEPSSNGWTSTTKKTGATTVDMQISANAGDYIWIASTQSGKQIYEFNEVSNSYNSDATPTTYVGQSTITLSTGATYSYHIYRTTNPRSGATNKKFKLA